MFERFTDSARQVVHRAGEQARELGAEQIGTEHLLVALAADRSGPAGRALRGLGLDESSLRGEIRPRPRSHAPDADALAVLGIDLDEVRRRVEAAFGPGALDRARPRRGSRGGGAIPFTPASKKTLELSLRQALHLGDNYIGTQHVLLGLLQGGADDGGALTLLRRRGCDVETVRAAVFAQIDADSGRAAG